MQISSTKKFLSYRRIAEISSIIVIILISCKPKENLSWSVKVTQDIITRSSDSQLNLLNVDNKIFKSNRVFTYAYEIERNKKSHEYGIAKSDNISDSVDVYIDSIRKLFGRKNVNYIDSLSLRVISTNGNTSLSESQTLIKYDYFSGEEILIADEVTGIVEDSSRIFLHPPRMYYFENLELCPFPQVYFPIVLGREWSGKLNIPENWFSYLPIRQALSVKCNYIVKEKKNINVLGNLEECYEIVGNGEIKAMNSSSAIFYFSEKYGFVKMVFKDPFGDTIKFKLIKLGYDSNI